MPDPYDLRIDFFLEFLDDAFEKTLIPGLNRQRVVIAFYHTPSGARAPGRTVVCKFALPLPVCIAVGAVTGPVGPVV